MGKWLRRLVAQLRELFAGGPQDDALMARASAAHAGSESVVIAANPNDPPQLRLDPEGLAQSADQYNAEQLRVASQQYDWFLSHGYDQLLQWITATVRDEAEHGGRLLTVEIDHYDLHVILRGSLDSSRRHALPFKLRYSEITNVIARLVTSISAHFQAQGFVVSVQELQPVLIRRRPTPRTSNISIYWVSPRAGSGTAEQTPPSELEDEQMEKTLHTGEPPSYQTVPLVDYDGDFKARADALFVLFARRFGSNRVKEHKGSYSIYGTTNNKTAAKIIIYEQQLGRRNGGFPPLRDGVYVLLRPDALISDGSPLRNRIEANETLAVAPSHGERFVYFRLQELDDLEVVASFVESAVGAAP